MREAFSLWRAGVEPCPEDERQLERDSQPLSPTVSHDAGGGQVGSRHVDVGWQDGDEEGYQSPRCGLARWRKQKTEAAESLCCSADVNDGEVGRQRWGDYFEVGSGKEEVETAGCYEKNG